MCIDHPVGREGRPYFPGVFRLTAALAGLILAACGEEGPIRPGTGDVHGIVVDRLGRPAGGVPVFVADKPPMTSESDGSFNVADVPAVYDATLISSPYAGAPSAILYQGLTRRNPVLQGGAVQNYSRYAFIAGWVPPSPSETRVIFAGEGFGTWQWADQASGEFGISVGWDGADRLQGRLHVVRGSAGLDSLPADFDAYATRDFWLGDGDSISTRFEAGDLVDPMEQTISGSVSLPSGYDCITWYGILFGTMYVKIGGHTSGSPRFEFRVPDLPELNYYVAAEGTTRDFPPHRQLYTRYTRTGIAPGTSGISIDLEAAPQLSQPADLAAGVTRSTRFGWSDGPGINVMVIASGNSFITVLLAGSETHLPDLSAHRLLLPAGREIAWWVIRYPLILSIDQAASGRFGPLSYAWPTDVALTRSQQFRFTVAP